MHDRLTGSALTALAAATLFTLAGCAHPENYRWSGSEPPVFVGGLTTPPGSAFADWSKPAVSMYSFATPAPTAGATGLKDLSDRGQAALIAAMTAAGAKPEDIRDALAKPLKAKAETGEDHVTSEGSYKRTLVANITKGWNARPGDRLVWTWIHVQPLNFVFDGYSVIATDNQLLNIEQITNATTAGVSGNLGKTGSETAVTNTAGSPVSKALTEVAGSSAGISGSLSNTYTTTAAINQQYTKLGADILPTELRILRESERNLDAAGNTLIALTMRLDTSRWNGVDLERVQRVTKLDVVKADGSFASPAEVVFEVVSHKAPPRCPLLAKVRLYYELRAPKDGRAYVEGQHVARYTKDSYDAGEVVIMPADEVRNPSWRVYPAASKYALQVSGLLGYDTPLDFASFEQAHNFAVWLGQHSKYLAGRMDANIGKAGFSLNSGTGTPLSSGSYRAERVKDDPDQLAGQCRGMLGLPPAAPVPADG